MKSIHFGLFAASFILASLAHAEDPTSVEPKKWREVTPTNLCTPASKGVPEVRAGGSLFAGSRPDTAEKMQYLKEHGVVRIEDLENDDKFEPETKMATDYGMTDVNYIMGAGFGPPSPKNGKSTDEEVAAALAEVRDPSLFDKPLYVHCKLGEDRTGMIIALHRVFDECWEPKAANSEWYKYQTPWGKMTQFPKHLYFDKVTKPGSKAREAFERALLEADAARGRAPSGKRSPGSVRAPR